MSNPRSLFYQTDVLAKWHRAVVNTDNFETSVTFALAEFGRNCPSSEQQLGAQRFLETFRLLSVKEEEAPQGFTGPRLTPPELLGLKAPDKPQPKK